MVTPARIALVGEHQLFRDCLASALGAFESFEVVGQFDDLCKAGAEMDSAPPDVVLVDVGLPEEAILHSLESFTEAYTRTKVIALGLNEVERDVLKFIEAGASAYVLKESSVDELRRRIELALRGETICSAKVASSSFSRLAELARARRRAERLEGLELTPREMQILRFIADGLSNKEIAAELCLSFHTVKNHVHNILEKLKLRRRSQIVEYAYRKQWIGSSRSGASRA